MVCGSRVTKVTPDSTGIQCVPAGKRRGRPRLRSGCVAEFALERQYILAEVIGQPDDN
jgi:hypothetical protein